MKAVRWFTLDGALQFRSSFRSVSHVFAVETRPRCRGVGMEDSVEFVVERCDDIGVFTQPPATYDTIEITLQSRKDDQR